MYPNLQDNIKKQLKIYKHQLFILRRDFTLKSIEADDYKNKSTIVLRLIKEYEDGLTKLTTNEPEFVTLDDLSEDGFINAFY